mmetsp:Transcript_24593/g.66313  ORF Transcript_24593/g.66313 Transcript_24593/m.66313 type:complete len:228 (+) Transcript_24593:552-1235(+)
MSFRSRWEPLGALKEPVGVSGFAPYLSPKSACENSTERTGLPQTSRQPAFSSISRSGSPWAAFDVTPITLRSGYFSSSAVVASAPFILPPEVERWKSISTRSISSFSVASTASSPCSTHTTSQFAGIAFVSPASSARRACAESSQIMTLRARGSVLSKSGGFCSSPQSSNCMVLGSGGGLPHTSRQPASINFERVLPSVTSRSLPRSPPVTPMTTVCGLSCLSSKQA